MYTKNNKTKSITRKYKKKKNNKKTKKYNKIRQSINKLKTKIKKGGGIVFDNNFLSCYDNNLEKIQNAISKFSGKHSIDKIMANKFIENQLSTIRKQSAKDLIDNTIYITLQEISEIIEKLVIQLYNDNNLNSESNIYLYSGNSNKSFYFMSVLMLYYIKKHNFKEPTYFVSELNDELFDIIGDDKLIIIDDVTYSGTQLSTLLNNIYFNRVVKNKKTVPNIYVLLIALNNFSKAKLSRVPIKRTRTGLDIDYVVSPFKLLFLSERLYEPLIIKLGIERYFNLNLFFTPYTESTPYVSLYLDHKLADEASTYKTALLYGPIVPSNYNYSDLLEKADFIYDILPSSSLLKSDELNTLIGNFNSENNTKFKSFGPSVIELLLNKLIANDIFDNSQPYIRFMPFINGCNKNNILLENISNEEIVNLDYRLFIAPKDCLASANECVVTNEFILEYLNELFSENNKSIQIHNKINSFICPISWYKNGEFKMTCT